MPSPKKILLAEDDADDRNLFHHFVQTRPEIELLPPSTNGTEVIKYLSTSSATMPHLIVLDQNMPMMSGKETLMQLKAEPRWAKIPVIVYSTYADVRLIRDCLSLGAAAVKSKPDSEEEYARLMDECLEILQNA